MKLTNIILEELYKFDQQAKKLTQDELPGSEWQNVKNVITAKGYEITQDSNYFDQDNDRAWYPSIKFEFDI